MLDARQIRDSEFIKNGVKRKAKAEAQQFLERTAGTVEQLQNENAAVRAENIELCERNARLSEMNARLEEEKEQLLQQLSGAAEFSEPANAPEETSDFSRDPDAFRAEIDELTEYNARLREAVAKLESENEQLLAQLAEPRPEIESADENESAALRAEISELSEYNARLNEANAGLEDEKAQLLQKLAVLQFQPIKPGSTESENMIKAAQEKAGLILERAERDYLLKMTRANAAIIQKTIAFEQEFGDNLRKLKSADGEVRQLKTQLSKLLEQMPDGIGENAEAILDRLKKQQ